MANTKILQVKRTTVSGRLPNTSSTSNSSYIYPGEFAFNLADRKLYSQYASVPFEVGANLSSLVVTGNASITGTLTVVGNTIYTGNVVYINTTNLTVGDNIITLNSDVTGSPTESAGIEINRGTSANVSFLWDEANTRWTIGSQNLFVGGSINAVSISVTNFTAANIAAVNLSTSNNFAVSNTSFDINTGIAGWHYSGKALSVNAKESVPRGVSFSSDGTKMYVVGTSSSSVHQYNLSSAFDVTTGTFASTLSVSTQEAAPSGLFFKLDGTKMYIIGTTSDSIHQYSLATAWNLSTATADGVSYNIVQDTSPTDIFFSPDGTSVFILGNTNSRVNKYTLSSAWNISTATFNNFFAFSSSSNESNATGLTFNSTGTIMYLVGLNTNYIFSYALSTPWDVTTATITGYKSVYNVESGVQGVFYSQTSNKFWIVGASNDTVYQYDTNDSAALKVTANSLHITGILSVSNNISIDGNFHTLGTIKAENDIQTDGNLTVVGTTLLGNTTTVTGAFTVTGTTTTTSIQSTQTSGTITLGGTTGTGAITVGQSTGVQTLGLATGATTSSNTKTVNIGTAGLSGSITNVNIGSVVSGATGTTTINSNNVVVPNNLAVTGTANVATTINVGANLTINTTSYGIGNSTINAVLTSTSLLIGNTVANTTAVAVGANVIANTTALLVGNSSVNSIITSSLLTTTTANLSTSVNVGANVNLSTTQIKVGNSSVNTVITSTTITGNAAATLGNTTINGSLTVTANTVAAQVNTTSINVGANVNISATQLNVGNSTVNTVITSTTMTGNGAGILNVNAATVGSNTASTLRTYSETQAANAYTTAQANSANATNISSGTLATARLPATVNVATTVNVGANVNLGTSSINVGNATINTVITSSTITTSGNVFASGGLVVNTNSSTDAVRITQLGAGNALLIEDDTSTDVTPTVIDTNGVLVRGATSKASHWSASVAAPESFFVGNSGSSIGVGIIGHATNPVILLARTANSTLGGRALIADSDNIGTITFAGDANTGSNFSIGARIIGKINGTANDTSLPGSLDFQVTPANALVPTSRMTINANDTITFSSNSNLKLGVSVLGNTQLAIGSTTSNATLTQTSLNIGTSTSNVQINSSSLTVGNTSSGTVNAFAINLGANVNISTSGLNIGNSTVNTFITASSISTNGTLTITGNTTAGQINATSINANNLSLSGNLTVSGSITYLNSTTLNIGDNLITLNADLTNVTAPTENAGIEVNRGSAANTSFFWDETNARWTAANNTYIAGTLTTTGNTVAAQINATSINVGANVTLNTTAISVGNSTVNSVITSTSISGNGAGILNVNAATVGSNTASDLRTYSETQAANAYSTGQANSANATNITSGTLATARLPATVNVATVINVGANVGLGTSQLTIGNTTVNSFLNATNLKVNTTTISSNALTISGANATANATILLQLDGGQAQVELGGSVGAYIDFKTPYADDYDYRLSAGDTGFTITAKSSTNAANSLFIVADSVFVNSAFTVANNTGNTFIMNANGDVGINTTGGGAGVSDLLHIRKDSNTNIGIVVQNRVANLSAQSSIKFITGQFDLSDSRYSEISGFTTAGGASGLQFRTGNGAAPSNRITILPAGNVGISNTAPDAALAVTGAANVSGNVIIGGTLSTSGNTVAAQINATSINVGANVIISTSQINVGNSTVNTVITSTSITGNGAGLTTVNAATVGSNTAGDLRTYSETQASNAYTTAVANTSNATNITSGTLATARLPSTVNVATVINVGANVNLGVTDLRIGNSTINAVISSTALTLSTNTATFGNAAYIAANGNISVGTTASNWKLLVNGPTVANVANSQSLVARFTANNQNSDALEITNTRGTDGGVSGDWTTAGFRLQQKVDATWMGYMQYNGTTSGLNNGGISFGTGQSTSNAISITERLRITGTGNIGISNTAPDATLKVTGTANVSGAVVIGGTTSIAGNTTIDATTLTTRAITANAINVTVTVATTGLDMNGSDIVDVNRINISDPGPYEGILIDGGSGWAIFESPNNLTTNGSGNLQFVVANTRVGTITSTGIDTPFNVTANLALSVIDTNGTATVNSTVVSVGSVAIGASLQKFITFTPPDTSSNQIADTIAIATYRSVRYTIQVTGGGFYQSSEVSLIHNGTTVYKTEYGINSTTATWSTCDADISGGNMRLLVTPLYAGSVYKIFRTAIPV